MLEFIEKTKIEEPKTEIAVGSIIDIETSNINSKLMAIIGSRSEMAAVVQDINVEEAGDRRDIPRPRI